jgi:hypothetical protein
MFKSLLIFLIKELKPYDLILMILSLVFLYHSAFAWIKEPASFLEGSSGWYDRFIEWFYLSLHWIGLAICWFMIFRRTRRLAILCSIILWSGLYVYYSLYYAAFWYFASHADLSLRMNEHVLFILLTVKCAFLTFLSLKAYQFEKNSKTRNVFWAEYR